MRKLILTTAAVMAAFTAPALAYEPSQGVTFREFVEARGCVIIDKGGYLTFAGGCPAANEFTPRGSILVDDDNDASTPDVWKSDT